jgi:RHS repeat-associated protein
VRSHRQAPCELFDGSGKLIWSGDQDDFGRLFEESEPGAPVCRLLGQQFDDETGLHYNRFRYYDPHHGRFISPDPIGLIGGMNSYLYGPNAINFSDPLGLFCDKTKRNSVYVLKKDGKIVYVGITERSAHTRMAEHKRGTDKIPKKDFDQMTVIATDLTRRGARNIEGSALLSIQKGDIVHADGSPMVLQNRTRKDDNYYHSYSDSTSGGGRQVQDTDTVLNHLNNNIASHPEP